MMQRTAQAMARLHVVPIPDVLRSSQPQLWTKIELFFNNVSEVYSDPQKTQR